MFERYTERARRVLFFARYEASELGSTSIEPEHLLLGLIREGKGLTTRIFAHWQISLDSIRKEIEGRVPWHHELSTSVEIPLSPGAKRALQSAADEADILRQNLITTEHLLLGILHEEQSVAAIILMEKGMQVDGVREEIQRLVHEAAVSHTNRDPTTLAEENRRLRAVIDHLLEQQRLGRQLQFHDDAYWLQGEGEVGEGPYCAACWNIDRRLVRKETRADGVLHCELCTRYGRRT
jgi:ATP-dependent Clp protease ATP-binding subunit ClpC